MEKKEIKESLGLMTNNNASAPTSKHSFLPPSLPFPPNPILPKTMFDLSPHKPDRFPDFLTENYGAMNIGVVRTQGMAVQNFGNFKTKDNRIPKFQDEKEESGVRTPPLWPGSPPRRPNNYRCLSPSSKAQAIAKGQKELMEMVSRMPESCYELSLKDLVEQPMMLEAKSENKAEIEGRKSKNKKNKEKKKKAQITRNRSVDNGGFLLKMVFPVSLGTKKKNKKTDTNSRVSPKPSGSDSSSSTKVEDKIWWKNKFSGSNGCESGDSSLNSRSTKSSRSSSSNSTSSNGSNIRRGMGGCCGII